MTQATRNRLKYMAEREKKMADKKPIDVEQLMRPECSSDKGFLNKTESLSDVIEQDKQTLLKLGLTYKQFADRLETLTEKAVRIASLRDCWNKIGEEEIVIEKKFIVAWTSYMGYQDCPYGCKGQEALSSTDFTITNIVTEQSVFFSELHIHLIKQHNFFEGHTKYRLDPAKCAEVLEIKPDIDYSPKYISKEYWVSSSGSTCGGYTTIKEYLDWTYEDDKVIILEGKEIPLTGNKKGWLFGNKMVIISLDKEDKSEQIIIDNVPIKRLCEGSYRYEKKVLKWVEDV